MSERSVELVTKAGQQFHEIAEFLGSLDEADLGKPCRGESIGTVGDAAARLADGYGLLGEFLLAAGYGPASATAETGRAPAQRSNGRGRGTVVAPAPAVRDLLRRLHQGKATIGRLAGLTDEQLDSVPPGFDRVADGRHTLDSVIHGLIAQQAGLLVALRGAAT